MNTAANTDYGGTLVGHKVQFGLHNATLWDIKACTLPCHSCSAIHGVAYEGCIVWYRVLPAQPMAAPATHMAAAELGLWTLRVVAWVSSCAVVVCSLPLWGSPRMIWYWVERWAQQISWCNTACKPICTLTHLQAAPVVGRVPPRSRSSEQAAPEPGKHGHALAATRHLYITTP